MILCVDDVLAVHGVPHGQEKRNPVYENRAPCFVQ